jgi:hypothetical protein
MQRWNRKKTHFPLLVVLLLVFIVFTVLYNESNIQRIQENPDHVHHHQEASVTYVKPNRLNPGQGTRVHSARDLGLLYSVFFLFFLGLLLNSWLISLLGCVGIVLFLGFGLMGLCWFSWIVEVLDRFSKCNSTRDYSGRRIAWVDRPAVNGQRRVASESCDVFSGKWVFDNTSHPLYNESECPYMSDQLACHKHGRSDLGYQYWRWQPHNCNLKR